MSCLKTLIKESSPSFHTNKIQLKLYILKYLVTFRRICAIFFTVTLCKKKKNNFGILIFIKINLNLKKYYEYDT